jgi:hypothetical protein
MRLGPTQIAVLRFIESRGKYGWTKENAPGNEWRVIDRLEQLGLIDNRFIQWQGPTYFINDKGRAATGVVGGPR